MTKKKYPVGTKVMEAPRSAYDLEETLEGVVIGLTEGFRVVRVTRNPLWYDPHKTLAFRVRELIPDTIDSRMTLNSFRLNNNKLQAVSKECEKSTKELDKDLRLEIENIQRR